MKKEEKVLLLAMVLGDGHIRPEVAELSITHGEAQKQYLEYKAELVSRAISKPITITSRESKIGDKAFTGYRFSCTHRFFRVLRKRCYYDNRDAKFDLSQLNKLSPQALAIWYMDDGSLYAKKRNGKIHAYELTISCCATREQDSQNIVNFFKEKYGIAFSIKRNKGLFSVRCGTREAAKFLEIVKPFIIPSMAYKASM